MDHRLPVLRVVAVLALATGACSDPGLPKTNTLSGTYVLKRIGEQTLPFRIRTYDGGAWDEIDRGAVRFRSRDRLTISATTVSRFADGSYMGEVSDSVVFRYRSTANYVELEFSDARGVHFDSLMVLQFGTEKGLRAISTNYFRAGWPAPLVRNAVYIQ